MDDKRTDMELTKNDMYGSLPHMAPLANPYVPFQSNNPKQYTAKKGLIRGTLFPGLDLPFMNKTNNTELSATLQHKLQALNFAVSELGLYLDTHPTDLDALELFNQYGEMYEEALQKYEEQKGPTMQMRAGMFGSYRWTDGPWPWEYAANKEG